MKKKRKQTRNKRLIESRKIAVEQAAITQIKKGNFKQYEPYSFEKRKLINGGERFFRSSFNEPKTTVEKLRYEASMKREWEGLEKTKHNTLKFFFNWFDENDDDI